MSSDLKRKEHYKTFTSDYVRTDIKPDNKLEPDNKQAKIFKIRKIRKKFCLNSQNNHVLNIYKILKL